jgi:hypothetical protein
VDRQVLLVGDAGAVEATELGPLSGGKRHQENQDGGEVSDSHNLVIISRAIGSWRREMAAGEKAIG